MRQGPVWLGTVILGLMLAAPAAGDVIYNNLTPNNLIGMATRPDLGGAFEIETGDDFTLSAETLITGASFAGLFVSPTGGPVSISDVVIEIYRVFPTDSDTTRLPAVPTRANSPSDVAFDSRDSAASGLTFVSTTLASSFTALNSIQPGGIHASPTPFTGGNGPVTGQETQIDATFSTPFDLPAGHYFFVPQVGLTSAGEFFWLSASRPISGTGTTPILPDLQAWTRDEGLDPDWLRVGTDIVGGTTAPTFNAAFSLTGTATPEPTTIVFLTSVLAVIAVCRYRASRRSS